MNKTGELLKKAREEKGLTLNEVGLSLKISSKILKAIEDNDTANLPAKTFLRGFVQSYAAFLRMDLDAVMNSFYDEVGTTRPQPILRTTAEEIDPSTTSGELKNSGDERTTIVVPEKKTSSARQQDHLAPINEKNNTKAIIIAVIGAVLLGLILFTKKMIDKYSREAKVDSKVAVSAPLTPAPSESPTMTSENEPPNPDATPEASPAGNTSSNTPAPSPTPSMIASLTNLKTKAIPSPAPSLAPSPVVKITPLPTPSPKPSPSPTASVTPTPNPTPTPSPSPSPSKTPEKSKSVELIIEALDDVTIDYASNNGKKSSIKLSAGQVHTFKSKDGLKLDISNGGAVNLILNGRDLEIPGDLGKPIKLSY